MLRTQDAVLLGNGGMTALCEAICLDAVDVAGAARVSIWFFGQGGELVCRRLLDTCEGRFHEGAIIPRSAAAAYIHAASSGRPMVATTAAPDLPGQEVAAGGVASRIDLLLVGADNRPVAIFRSERRSGMPDWSDRDITILRNLARALATVIRYRDTDPATADLPPVPTVRAPLASARHDFPWLPSGAGAPILLGGGIDAQAFGGFPGPDGAVGVDMDWSD